MSGDSLIGPSYGSIRLENGTKRARPTFWRKVFIFLSITAATCFGLTLVVFALKSLLETNYTPLQMIPKVKDAEIDLIPLTAKRVAQLGLDVNMDMAGFEEQSDEMAETTWDIHNTENGGQDIGEAGSGNGRVKVERLVMVGDVHGQFKQLKALLRKIRFDSRTDRLLLLGDFIAKGPDSKKVLDFAIQNNVSCVLGNHEYYVLQYYSRFHRIDSPGFSNTTQQPSFDMPSSKKLLKDPEYRLARSLEPHHIKYINSCPVIRRLGRVPLHKKSETASHESSEGIAVHAGVRWDLMDNLYDQDPGECLEMRSLLGPHYNESTSDPDEPGAVSWSKIFNEKQKELYKAGKKPFTVFYGHDARRGLKVKRFTKGLDSGCVKGRELTASILWREYAKDSKHDVVYKDKYVKVSC
ncbi:Piso0_003500 [Millerozyma farinosa CBS 7064]|uniref:Piso0_003500 protein n=1 Tax=Pichia sorbitophila (strain ATCC MYA-4447 / BCRC 22081 / CBS 7064 / NBRC 10061 / NRRL Y-12695) TaxID=559304 RepID=G8YJ89_PICSO|nr:Piso0_003500 [Millerozyma farinosa CBS 7064]CCE81149.1 Piso0_003500 [Millerozyma farinosa CBS 7064]